MSVMRRKKSNIELCFNVPYGIDTPDHNTSCLTTCHQALGGDIKGHHRPMYDVVCLVLNP